MCSTVPLALAQWWLSRWRLRVQERPKRMASALASLVWQQEPGLAWQRRPVFSRLVLPPVWLQLVWLRLVLRLSLVWRRLAWQQPFLQLVLRPV